MKNNKKLLNTLNKFVSSQQKLAEKYKCKISISSPGMEEVVIADGRKEKTK